MAVSSISTRSRRATDARITRIAHDVFGFDDFRPGQIEAIRALSGGQDTLSILPTGAGKSAIYQIAALLTEGITLVVSPLIALQQDQVAGIGKHRIGRAVAVNSSLSARERDATLAEIARGDVRFVFLAPEQLANTETVSALSGLDLAMVVIDEAHCISEWGHDFRPEYLRLGAAIEHLGHPTICALTATAAPPVRTEIVQRLGMDSPATVVSGFDRPNIRLGVERVDGIGAKLEMILTRIDDLARPGIIYAATRRQTEEIASALRDRGVTAVAYHAGLRGDEREAAQAGWMAGEHEVIVATIAFGMGIDKPDVRFVLHASISESLDAYYQEFGRAGRDGEPAEAILLYDPKDLDLRRFQSGSGELPEDEVVTVLESIHGHRGLVDPADVHEEVDLNDSRLMRVVDRLAEVGAVEVEPDGTLRKRHPRRDIGTDAHAAAAAQRQHQQFARSRLEMMRRYADQDTCRRADLIAYFGESFQPPCGNCDNCLAGHGIPREDTTDRPFAIDSTVHHREWGEGVVLRYENDLVVVLFGTVGYRTLLVRLAHEQGLLTTVPTRADAAD
ncbi:MAG: ATP-dependent DNA helicase RecQ [uncultured Thermomicrobiales bacterium]|uniref:ATP-dependent DNA helicase RecQ n=1 Tax=uncultured Thermomicrobiales bacterium TaxID=1645740 RepID=A0A6J4UBB3_9BACT|nr:MAG: ATP-dependent DNA helicase RecQ [uncultured Thermomicrobiales bacterium]